jgi:hypothetical protein
VIEIIPFFRWSNSRPNGAVHFLGPQMADAVEPPLSEKINNSEILSNIGD